jgi:hypothetical protein
MTAQRTITVGELAANTLEAKAIWWLVEHEEARIICRGFTVTSVEAKGDIIRLEYRTLFPTYETRDKQCDVHFFKASGPMLVQSQVEVDALRQRLADVRDEIDARLSHVDALIATRTNEPVPVTVDPVVRDAEIRQLKTKRDTLAELLEILQ